MHFNRKKIKEDRNKFIGSKNRYYTYQIETNLEKKNYSVTKSVKVVACYFGHRRNHPKTSKDTLLMLNFLWGREQQIDHGVPMDTIFVYNKLPENQIQDMENYKKCEEFLYSFDGKKTKNGECIVVQRENIGISYGAFDFAFHNFKDRYDYWLFMEDDHIIIKDGVMKEGISQLYSQNTCGLVALVGVSKRKTRPIHAHGSCGCVHRDTLNEIVNNPENYSEKLGRGCLPYFYCSEPNPRLHVNKSEFQISNWIHRLGYSLCNINMERLVVIWRAISDDRSQHANRLVVFDDLMISDFNLYSIIEKSFAFGCTQDRKEIADFVRVCKDKKIKNILEIGYGHGGTFYLLCSISSPYGKKISLDIRNKDIKIDQFIGDIHKIIGNSHLFNSLEKVKDILKDEKLDLLFIDGDHSSDGVKEDYNMYKDLVKEGGVIAFHDIKDTDFHRRRSCYVSHFWKELDSVKIEIINESCMFGGIGYIVVPKDGD